MAGFGVEAGVHDISPTPTPAQSRRLMPDMCQDPHHLFSLISYPDQSKEDTSFISVIAYGVYIRISRPIQFCLLTNQNFEKKNAQNPANPAEPSIQDPSGFLPIFMGFK